MPDMAMCSGGECPKKDECYRYRAIPNEFRQSYFSKIPCDLKNKVFDRFTEINGRKVKSLNYHMKPETK